MMEFSEISGGHVDFYEIDGRICRIVVSNELSEKCFSCFMFFPDLLTGNFRLRKSINRIQAL